jgi:hypothetical protein
MIIVTDKITTTPVGIGKGLEFLERMLKELSESGVMRNQWTLLRPHTGGREVTLVATARFSSMAEYEEFDKNRMADSGYKKLVSEVREADWFLGNERTIYDVIDTYN